MSCLGEFRDLSVYQRSVELGDALHLSVAAWDSFDRWSIGIQTERGLHVPSNAHADARAVGRMLNGLIKARAQP